MFAFKLHTRLVGTVRKDQKFNFHVLFQDVKDTGSLCRCLNPWCIDLDPKLLSEMHDFVHTRWAISVQTTPQNIPLM